MSGSFNSVLQNNVDTKSFVVIASSCQESVLSLFLP